MSGAAWFLLVVVYLELTLLVLAASRVHRLRKDLARRPDPVAPLPRQESTDQLPISLALYGSWTRPANGCTAAQLEAVKAAVRVLHPDLATALDRAVDAHATRANLAARRPDPVTARPIPPQRTPGRFGTTPTLEACNRGHHDLRPVEGMEGVQVCRVCDHITGVA